MRFIVAPVLLALIVPLAVGQTPLPEVLPPPLPPSVETPPTPVPPVVESSPAGMHAGPGCAPPVVEKTVPLTQILLVPRERAICIPDWKLRDVELGRKPAGPVLDFREEKQIVTELKLQEREEEQQVTCMESKPVTVTEPCGKCRTEYHPCPVVKTVKVKVYCTVPVQREVVVRVPVLKPGGELVVKGLALDKTTVPAIERRFEAAITPNELKVLIPVPSCLPEPHCPGCPHGK
jgi:hypothetical protein